MLNGLKIDHYTPVCDGLEIQLNKFGKHETKDDC